MNEHEKEFLEDAAKDFNEEYEKRETKKFNIIFFTICIILICIATLLGIYFFKDLSKEKILYNSLNNMKIKDKNEIDMKIYSTEDYAKVEKIIKESYKTYLDSYSTLNEQYKLLNSTNFLNIDVYKKEAANNFSDSKKRLEDNLQKRNEAILNIQNLYAEDTIKKNIKENNLNNYYEKLYRKLLNELNYKSHVDSINKYEKEIKSHTDSINDILDYLSQNKDKWEVSENELVSYDSNFITEFNDKISKLNNEKK